MHKSRRALEALRARRIAFGSGRFFLAMLNPGQTTWHYKMSIQVVAQSEGLTLLSI